MPQKCECCAKEMPEEEVVTQMESAEIFCAYCGPQMAEIMPGEVAKVVPLSDIHPDWRTS